jgi:hypothetical protein
MAGVGGADVAETLLYGMYLHFCVTFWVVITVNYFVIGSGVFCGNGPTATGCIDPWKFRWLFIAMACCGYFVDHMHAVIFVWPSEPPVIFVWPYEPVETSTHHMVAKLFCPI